MVSAVPASSSSTTTRAARLAAESMTRPPALPRRPQQQGGPTSSLSLAGNDLGSLVVQALQLKRAKSTDIGALRGLSAAISQQIRARNDPFVSREDIQTLVSAVSAFSRPELVDVARDVYEAAHQRIFPSGEKGLNATALNATEAMIVVRAYSEHAVKGAADPATMSGLPGPQQLLSLWHGAVLPLMQSAGPQSSQQLCLAASSFTSLMQYVLSPIHPHSAIREIALNSRLQEGLTVIGQHCRSYFDQHRLHPFEKRDIFKCFILLRRTLMRDRHEWGRGSSGGEGQEEVPGLVRTFRQRMVRLVEKELEMLCDRADDPRHIGHLAALPEFGQYVADLPDKTLAQQIQTRAMERQLRKEAAPSPPSDPGPTHTSPSLSPRLPSPDQLLQLTPAQLTDMSVSAVTGVALALKKSPRVPDDTWDAVCSALCRRVDRSEGWGQGLEGDWRVLLKMAAAVAGSQAEKRASAQELLSTIVSVILDPLKPFKADLRAHDVVIMLRAVGGLDRQLPALLSHVAQDLWKGVVVKQLTRASVTSKKEGALTHGDIRLSLRSYALLCAKGILTVEPADHELLASLTRSKFSHPNCGLYELTSALESWLVVRQATRGGEQQQQATDDVVAFLNDQMCKCLSDVRKTANGRAASKADRERWVPIPLRCSVGLLPHHDAIPHEKLRRHLLHSICTLHWREMNFRGAVEVLAALARTPITQDAFGECCRQAISIPLTQKSPRPHVAEWSALLRIATDFCLSSHAAPIPQWVGKGHDDPDETSQGAQQDAATTEHEDDTDPAGLHQAGRVPVWLHKAYRRAQEAMAGHLEGSGAAPAEVLGVLKQVADTGMGTPPFFRAVAAFCAEHVDKIEADDEMRTDMLTLLMPRLARSWPERAALSRVFESAGDLVDPAHREGAAEGLQQDRLEDVDAPTVIVIEEAAPDQVSDEFLVGISSLDDQAQAQMQAVANSSSVELVALPPAADQHALQLSSSAPAPYGFDGMLVIEDSDQLARRWGEETAGMYGRDSLLQQLREELLSRIEHNADELTQMKMMSGRLVMELSSVKEALQQQTEELEHYKDVAEGWQRDAHTARHTAAAATSSYQDISAAADSESVESEATVQSSDEGEEAYYKIRLLFDNLSQQIKEMRDHLNQVEMNQKAMEESNAARQQKSGWFNIGSFSSTWSGSQVDVLDQMVEERHRKPFDFHEFLQKRQRREAARNHHRSGVY
ncbi:unnamed protein product [Vitrella brassicaformis CCMP3155]|uniref:Uncharacterized protein n=3 Tax=Vitrella brassicaformis TaxID=1169539 RepID=A0A0G4FXA5_VITBC|nr:unnamed protein product [Vitrella brassicaformis CCMP3155]|eukprot:CEM20027.1 unnamed protein product [Vitrella brassicaformis CCMP3155]